MDKVRNPLETFLFSASNSHAKESLINNKLLFDLKLAAAQQGYFLNVYLPEVDQDGFDMIFDDHDAVIKTQLKTVMVDASTQSWKIHKRILRPPLNMLEELGFEFSPAGEGVGGGVILIEIDAKDEFKIKYYYTDVIILCGFRDNLLQAKRPPKSDIVRNLFIELHNDIETEKINLPRSLFLEAHSAEALLGLMGLNNRISGGIWRLHLMNLAEPRKDEKDLPSPAAKLIELVNEEIEKLSPRISAKP